MVKRWCLALFLVVLLPGCLSVATTEVRAVVTEDWVITTTDYIDVSSDDDPGDLREDFDELVNSWKGDEFLLGAVSSGDYIKKRDVFVKDGKLCARILSIGKAPSGAKDHRIEGKEQIVTIEKESGFKEIKTAGRVVSEDKDHIDIAWPAAQKELSWSIVHKLDEDHAANRKTMIRLFNEYRWKQPLREIRDFLRSIVSHNPRGSK